MKRVIVSIYGLLVSETILTNIVHFQKLFSNFDNFVTTCYTFGDQNDYCPIRFSLYKIL